MENINLLRRIAWDYHCASGFEWEELFQEACIAYLESLPSYDTSRACLSTFIWCAVSSHLKNFLQKETKYRGLVNIDEAPERYVEAYSFHINTRIQEVVDVMGELPLSLSPEKKKQDRSLITKALLSRGWRYADIWRTYRQIKLMIN